MNSDLLLERLAQEIGVGIINQKMLVLQLEEAQAATQAALAAKVEADAGVQSIGLALRQTQLEVVELQAKLDKRDGKAKPKPTGNSARARARNPTT